MSSYNLGDVESQLISRIYDAATDVNQWRSVLQSIAQACNADQCSMFFYDAQCRARNFAVAARIKEDLVDKYLLEFIDVEAADFHKQLCLIDEGEVVTENDLLNITGKTYDEILGIEYMETFMPKLQFGAGIILLHDNMMCSGLGVRRFFGAPLFDRETLDFLKRITPHLVQSIKIHNHINRANKTNQAILELLNHICKGVFLLDCNLRVIFSNAEAARILESCAVLEIGRQGKLFLTSAQEDKQFQLLCEGLVQVAAQPQPEILQTVHFAAQVPDSLHPLKISLSAVQGVAGSLLSREGVRLVMFVSDPERGGALPQFYLQKAYSLTATECNIIGELLNNRSVSDIAKLRGTTLETTRSQLKIIMQKTHTHSQAELSRLMVALDGDVTIG